MRNFFRFHCCYHKNHHSSVFFCVCWQKAAAVCCVQSKAWHTFYLFVVGHLLVGGQITCLTYLCVYYPTLLHQIMVKDIYKQ